jgi:hypothetical protein
VFAQTEEEQCWFGIEQEFSIFLPGMKTPLGWPSFGFPEKEVSKQLHKETPHAPFPRSLMVR